MTLPKVKAFLALGAPRPDLVDGNLIMKWDLRARPSAARLEKTATENIRLACVHSPFLNVPNKFSEQVSTLGGAKHSALERV